MSRDRLGQVLVWWPVKRVLDDRCEGGVTCPLTPVKATVLLRHTCVCVHTCLRPLALSVLGVSPILSGLSEKGFK